jgi:hypothetical protein
MSFWSTKEVDEDDSNLVEEIDKKDKEIATLRTQVASRERAHIEFLERIILELIHDKKKEEPAKVDIPPMSKAMREYLDRKKADIKQTGKAP